MPRNVPTVRPNQSLLSTPSPEATDAGSKGTNAPLLADGTPNLGDGYEVQKELGRGGMGTVYLARNTLMDRLEVIKVMNAEIAAKPGVADRFLKEIQAAARLNHPNVVTAYSALRPNGGLALSMAFVGGIDLDKLVKSNGPLSLLRACNYVAQAARGLQHALDQGLVHRDIKPANLMTERVKNKTVVKVLDFGLAKFKGGPEGPGLTHQGQMMGTPAYVAPEQAMDAAKADTRADVYSLGCTLYFLIAGRPPFDGGVMEVLAAHAMTPPRPLPEVRPDVPADLWTVIAWMLAKKPVDRYQTPGAVEKALLPFIKPGAAQVSRFGTPAPLPLPAQPLDASVLEYEPPPVEPVIRQKPVVRSSSPWLIPGLAFGFVAVVVAAFFGFTQLTKTPEGTLVVEANEPEAEVLVDGPKVPPASPPPAPKNEEPARPVVATTWLHKAGNGPGNGWNVKLYSNGRINHPNEVSTWVVREDTIILCWANPDAPGGYWVDVCRLHANGTRYSGANQIGNPIEGTKLCDGDIDAK